MKRILVPTDFSANAENALYYAIEMAKKEKAIIILFHAYQLNDDGTDSLENLRKRNNEQAKIKLQSLTTIIEHAGGIKYECDIKEGNVVDSVLKAVTQTNSDLIIMGTKGESNLADIIFGSNTANIINKAKCPVITIPECSSFKTIKKITYATDYRSSDVLALKKVLEIASSYKAQLNILHIAEENESPENEKKLMERFMKEVNATISYNNLSFQMMAASDIEDKLREYLESGSTDLLVMSTHERGLLNILFGRSLTREMTYNNNTPVMAFHYNNESAVKLFA